MVNFARLFQSNFSIEKVDYFKKQIIYLKKEEDRIRKKMKNCQFCLKSKESKKGKPSLDFFYTVNDVIDKQQSWLYSGITVFSKI